MYGNKILCDRIYGSVTQTNCFKHVYKILHDNPPRNNSTIPSLRGFLKNFSDRFRVVYADTLSAKDPHSFYNGLLKFDDFMDQICQIKDVSVEDCDVSRYQCWKIFAIVNENEIKKMSLPEDALYKLWLIYCKLDVKGELKVARPIFKEFLSKLMDKSEIPLVDTLDDIHSKSHLDFPAFLSVIQEQCFSKLPKDYGMVIANEIYDTLFKGSLKQGYLHKMGRHLGSSKRWFMLTPDTLQYYDSKMKTSQCDPKGIIHISAYSNLRAEGSSTKMDKFYFCVTCTRSKKKFTLYCDDATERQHWIKSINKAIRSQYRKPSIASLQRQDIEIGLEKWSFNYLLGLIDSLASDECLQPAIEGSGRWNSTMDLSINNNHQPQNREETLRRKSLEWGRPDICKRIQTPPIQEKPSPPHARKPKPPTKIALRRPPTVKRMTNGYMEMHIPETPTGYSSGYSSSTGSRSDEDLDDLFESKPRPSNLDIRNHKNSPNPMKRQNSGYVDMQIPNYFDSTVRKTSLEIESPLECILEGATPRTTSLSNDISKGHVQSLIQRYAVPIIPINLDSYPKSVPASPNPLAKFSLPSSKDSYHSDTPDFHRAKTVTPIVRPVPSRKPKARNILLSTSKLLKTRANSKSQTDLILI